MTNYRNILLLSAALMAAPQAYAGALDNTKFYVGAGLGYTTGDDGYEDIVMTGEHAYDGFEAGLYAGARTLVAGKFGLGLEGGVDFLNKVESDQKLSLLASLFYGTPVDYKFEKKYSVYLAVQPTYALSEQTTLFGSVGWQHAEYDADLEEFLGTENFNGLRLGVGVDQVLSEDLTGRLEVTHVDYATKEYDFAGADYKLNPSETNARIGVAYSF